LQTGRALREQEAAKGNVTTQLPYKTPEFQTVIWKDMAIAVVGRRIRLSTGRGRPALALPLPPEYQQANIRRAELVWRADHFELCLTLDTGEALPDSCAEGAAAGVDLGEIHIAAVATSGGEALIISGRGLRSCKRLRNKRHAIYQRLLARCERGSRRWRRLKRRHAQASARFFRQQRASLHQASRKVVAFCQREGVGRIAVGDVRDIQSGVRLGRNNQKIAQWPHGQFYQYLSYKAERKGLRATYVAEDFSTVTCSTCGYRLASSPRQRMFACASCGTRLHRDVNGAANICSRALQGEYGHIQCERVMCARPSSQRI
jgi:putative transposase